MNFFKIIKDHGPKNPPPGCNLGALLPSPSGIFFKKKSAECSVHPYSSPWISLCIGKFENFTDMLRNVSEFKSNKLRRTSFFAKLV